MPFEPPNYRRVTRDLHQLYPNRPAPATHLFQVRPMTAAEWAEWVRVWEELQPPAIQWLRRVRWSDE